MVFPLHSPPPFSYPFDCSFSANSTPFRLTFSSLPHVVVALPKLSLPRSSPVRRLAIVGLGNETSFKAAGAKKLKAGARVFLPCIFISAYLSYLYWWRY